MTMVGPELALVGTSERISTSELEATEEKVLLILNIDVDEDMLPLRLRNSEVLERNWNVEVVTMGVGSDRPEVNRIVPVVFGPLGGVFVPLVIGGVTSEKLELVKIVLETKEVCELNSESTTVDNAKLNWLE